MTRKWIVLLLTASVFFSIKTAMGKDTGTHSGKTYCLLILRKLAGPKKTFGGKLYFFATARKTEYLEAPPEGVYTENPTSVSFGIRFTLPLLDQKERIDRLRDYISRLDRARKLLSNYLTLRREIEAWEKYLLWRKKRVCAGVEYLTNLWRDAIDVETKKEELKALEVELCSLGIPKAWLDKCYMSQVVEFPKYPYPAGVPKCQNATTY